MRFTPLALPANTVDELLDSMAEGLASAPVNSVSLGAARRAIADALYVPEHYPPVQDVSLASTGELWMKTFEDAGVDSLSVWYTVRVGETERDSPVRRVLLPTSFLPHDATDTHVWGVQRDAFDVRYVVGRRLVRQGGEPG